MISYQIPQVKIIPSLKFIVNSVLELKNNITKSLNNYALQLTTSKQQYQGRALKFIDEVSEIPEKERLLKNIVRQQTIKESLYLLLLRKREEAAINFAITEPSVKVVEHALSSSSPISPKKNRFYAGAVLAGLLLPFGFLYLMFMLDTKVHTREDIEKVTTNIPILAEIPEIKKKGNLLFTNPNATSVLAESFRILSANVDYVLPKSDGKNKGKVIFSTSTIKGEGKTFVSLNLSLALASLNKKVYKVSDIPEKERLLKNIVRQQQIKESLYLLLLQKREEAAINLAITEPSIKVVEYALTSSTPISPKKNIIYQEPC